MKHTVKALLAAALLSSAAVPAFAQDGAPLIASTKTAVVNIQMIMRDATAAKSVRDQLEAKQKAYQAEISKKEEALQKEDQELGKQRATLAKDVFESKVKALREKATATQKEVASKKATLDNAFESALGQIQKTVSEIITEQAKEKGFVVALPSSQILYADGSLDISQEVLTQLNKRLPKIDVKFEAPKAKN
jgi:Skp family chaperone for outer membrane proteins